MFTDLIAINANSDSVKTVRIIFETQNNKNNNYICKQIQNKRK